MSESTSRDVRLCPIRRILSVVVMLEAVLCAGSGAFLAVETAVARVTDPGASAAMGVLAMALAGALLLAVRAVGRGRRAARSPIIVWQLMQLSVAQLTLGTPWLPIGILLTILAVVAVGAALWPGVLQKGLR